MSEFRALLFDSAGSDRSLDDVDGLAGLRPGEEQLLWVDVQGLPPTEVDDIGRILGLPARMVSALTGAETTPALANGGPYFWLRVVAVVDQPGLSFQGSVLTLVSGRNIVLTCHRDPLSFIDQIRARETGETELGRLSSASFTAALLDWQLSTYFEAVSRFEMAVERLEVEVLGPAARDCLGELRELRKGASRLRRMLAPHRVVFAGMARPDFRPQEEGAAERHFLALDERFERAMDVVENARDLVIGSFELFSSHNALQTNLQMRVLTFATVVIGMLAVLAGILGMNFEAPIYRSGALGFWATLAAMAGLLLAAAMTGRLKRWF